MNTLSFTNYILLLAIFGGNEVLSLNMNITSPPVTDWGAWGRFERCPFGLRAQGFQLKTESFKGPFTDDTAVNGIRLFCGDPFNQTTPVLTSTVGDFGSWGSVYSCYPGSINGFQLRVESNLGSGDDTATNNMRAFCSNSRDQNEYIEGDGLLFGSWGASQRCYTGQTVAGLQTQVEDCTTTSDCTALNNVLMECWD